MNKYTNKKENDKNKAKKLYLRGIVDPLPIYEKLVLVLPFRQVQDRYEVIMA